MIGQVSTSFLFQKFKIHLEQERNEKILFSAKYGAGKSTFLKAFFEQNTEYYPVILSPVNYVVNTSSDLFELIKVDVIRQLFQDEILTVKVAEEVKLSTILLETIKEQPVKILAQVAKLASALTPAPSLLAASAVSNGVNDLLETVKAVESKIKNKADLQKHAEEYYEMPGTFLEYNVVSQLLVAAINKVNELKRIPVLIIDDMDRMDPEHVFRILNVFSAHYNNQISGHKLGFDKVIVVADYENLEQMYYHRYGPRTDFSGYIEKFYSSQLFRFDIRSAIKDQLLKIAEGMSLESITLLTVILNYFVQTGEIKIRNLAKLEGHRLEGLTEDIVFKTDFKNIFGKSKMHWPIAFTGTASNVIVRFSSFEEMCVLRILLLVFGDVSALERALKREVPPKYSKLPLSDFEKLVKSIALMEHFLDSIKSSKDIPDLIRSRTTNSHGQLSFDDPRVTFEGLGVKISTDWNLSDQYSEDKCYFKYAKILVNHMPENTNAKLDIILATLRTHLVKVQEMGWLDKVGVTSAH